MPDIRPFRALRYDPADVADPGARRRAAVRRHRRARGASACSRAIRPTSSASTCRTSRPATSPTIAIGGRHGRSPAWRSDGTLHKDPHPSIYVYEQTYRVPGHRRRADAARLLRPASARAVRTRRGVLPHERTLSGPKEDRYKLLRATGVNTSPVVGAVRRRRPAPAASVLDAVDRRRPDVDLTDDDGVRHRLWAVAGRRGRRARPSRRSWPPPRAGP